MMSYRSGAFWISCLAAFLAAPAARAQAITPPDSVGAAELYQQDPASGTALGGFDPVSYFLPDGPKPGRPDFELIWGGVAWRFASEANRAAFEATPTAYAPRVGGYDAQVASVGRIVDANPALYVISRNRLYLFRNDANRARFLSDEARALESEAGWQQLRRGLVKP
jgi:YHS domain-containing protein